MADLNAIENALSALTATVQQLAAATLPPAERLLSEKWSSYIHDYSSIASNLGIIFPSAAVIAPLMGGLSFTLPQAVGAQLPCSVQQGQGRLSPHRPLAKIDSPSFRPQMLAWASTGCPSVELANTLSIGFSTFGCTEYHPETIQSMTVDAIDNWLLTEILGSIGDFSIL
ncbi:hypothetical protein K438DRAFT_1764253 [Mycena galopus ATCC 62051]|nr:hypothetical protein K438DRAFT_1764253 [Mycena galopus ATCC 62051]